jgi:hypothetical protein
VVIERALRAEYASGGQDRLVRPLASSVVLGHYLTDIVDFGL